MNINNILSQDDQQVLRTKVEKEYSMADTHTRSWKTSVQSVGKEFLFPEPGQDRVKVRKIWNNLNIRKSIFLSDELQVTNVPMNGVLGSENAKNTDKVFKANFKSMDIRPKYEEVLVDDALQGIGCLAVDGWNDHSQEPIVSYVDSRVTFPDPKNWRGNQMRFFGTLLRKSIYELESDSAYDFKQVQMVKMQRDVDLQQLDRDNSDIKGFTDTDVGEDLVDVYNHITIFKSSKDKEYYKYLTTWGADRTTLIRVVKMSALTDDEKADPSKISLGISLFRSKPIKGSYAGASLPDEIGQYQDLETLLTNLQISQAIEAGLGGKTFVDDALGIDVDDLASRSGPAVIPYTTKDPSKNANNSISIEPTRPQNPAVINTIGTINQLSQEATNMSSLVQGQSLSGSQTKAEVQTLQQNINQGISLMASNYMESLKNLWEDVYRSYAINMSSQRVKKIVVVDGNKTDAYGFKKNEFISQGEFYVIVSSKAQEDIKKKQDFAVLLSVVGVLKQSLTPGSTQSIILDRKLIEKSGIRGLDPEVIHPLTQDERKAYTNLEMLNRDIELKTKPAPGEDHNVYINIYKTGLDTEAREKAISLREAILTAEPPKQEAPAEQGGNATAGLGASMLAGQQAEQSGVSSLSDVAV